MFFIWAFFRVSSHRSFLFYSFSPDVYVVIIACARVFTVCNKHSQNEQNKLKCITRIEIQCQFIFLFVRIENVVVVLCFWFLAESAYEDGQWTHS